MYTFSRTAAGSQQCWQPVFIEASSHSPNEKTAFPPRSNQHCCYCPVPVLVEIRCGLMMPTTDGLFGKTVCHGCFSVAIPNYEKVQISAKGKA